MDTIKEKLVCLTSSILGWFIIQMKKQHKRKESIFSGRNFALTSYRDEWNREKPMYLLDRESIILSQRRCWMD